MNIFVGNLPFNLTEDGLKSIFSEFGEVVSAKIILDHSSGRSKGFGFVEMAKKEDAEAAIDKLNEKEIDGRNIRVNVAKPKENSRNKRPKFK